MYNQSAVVYLESARVEKGNSAYSPFKGTNTTHIEKRKHCQGGDGSVAGNECRYSKANMKILDMEVCHECRSLFAQGHRKLLRVTKSF